MTTYQLVPYLVAVTIRTSPSDVRPIEDVDARGTTLVDAIAKVLSAARGQLFQDPDDEHRRLGVTSLHKGARALFVELTPGRSGVRSSILKADGTQVDRDVDDTELTPVRHLFYAPAGGHHILMFAERVGQAGAVTISTRLLQQTFEKYMPDLRLEVKPAMTEDVLRRMTADQPVKAIVFKRPRPADPGGKLIEVAGKSVEVEVRMKPRRRHYWSIQQLPGVDGAPTTEGLLGVLAPVLNADKDRTDAVNSLLDDGWESSLAMRMPGGTQRLVNVGSSRSITMSFPINPEDDGDEPLERPNEELFRRACTDTLAMLEGQYNVRANAAEDCLWPADEWNDSSTDLWEVRWDVSGTQPSPS
jgi:hypothetical protein